MDENEHLIIVITDGIVNKALVSIDKDKTQWATLRFLLKNMVLRMICFLLMVGIKTMIVFLS